MTLSFLKEPLLGFMAPLCATFGLKLPLVSDNAFEIVQPCLWLWQASQVTTQKFVNNIFLTEIPMGTCASYTCVSFFNYQVNFKPCGGISFKWRWPRFWHGVSLPFFRCAWLVTMDVDLAPTPWLHPSIRSTVRMCARPVLALTSNVAGVLLVKVVHIRINGLVVVPQR